MPNEQNKVITFRLPEALAQQLEERAKASQTSVSRLLQDLVAELIEEENPEHYDPPHPLLIRYFLHIIYELVRTRVSLFSIAEGRLLDEAALQEVYDSARETARTYIGRLEEEMTKSLLGLVKNTSGDRKVG
ncbi:MAG TPA: ribbon-helix-helix protein, CopG family [Candidatus Binataceae bacterium]|nr:ribbon-helix-helix protein, CopG family [Candidatus Binataceae bacterium]